jgi:hypothetical protein
LVLFFLLPAHSLYGGEPAARYYPLKPGLTWTYNVSSDKSETRKIVVTNLPAKEINGISVTPRKWDKSGLVSYSLMATDNMGIYRYAEQKDEDAEPVPIKPKSYSLRDPVATGTTWEITSKMGEAELTVNLTIDSIIETVTVPAGTFKDCAKIKHKGGSQKEDAGFSLEAYEWYAPEVGLVKSIVTITRIEKKAKIAEHLTYQLESFQAEGAPAQTKE